jgi:DNA-binding NtrC family response regulator
MYILYCEDDIDTAEAVRIALTQQGHIVDYAQTADQAISLFDSASKPYDLLITDIEMKGHLGLVFAHHARTNGYEGRIVVLTGHGKETFLPSIQQVNGEYWQKTDIMNHIKAMLTEVTHNRRVEDREKSS